MSNQIDKNGSKQTKSNARENRRHGRLLLRPPGDEPLHFAAVTHPTLRDRQALRVSLFKLDQQGFVFSRGVLDELPLNRNPPRVRVIAAVFRSDQFGATLERSQR